MAKIMRMPEPTSYYERVAIKVISKIDNTAIGNAPSVTVDYDGKTYATSMDKTFSVSTTGKYVYRIVNFPQNSSSVTVNCHVSCDGYSMAKVQTQTIMNDFSSPTEVSLYPVTINGQIHRLSDAKQKFVDAFPTILKKEDSIEDYPKMMEECVPLIVSSGVGVPLFEIKEIGVTVSGNSVNSWPISKSLISSLTIEFLKNKESTYSLNIALTEYRNKYYNTLHILYDKTFTDINSGDIKTISIPSTPIAEIVYFNLAINLPCLIKNTLITLSDGTKKYVQDVTFDDELLVWDFYEGRFSKAKPMFIKKAELTDKYNLCKFSDGAELGLVGSDGYHRIWNNEANEFTHTGKPETPNGTHTFNESGERPELVSQEIIHEPVEFYNIITEKHYNLFANGILTSNRWSNRYGIKDMKYVLDDERMSEEHINEMIDDMRANPFWMYNEAKN